METAIFIVACFCLVVMLFILAAVINGAVFISKLLEQSKTTNESYVKLTGTLNELVNQGNTIVKSVESLTNGISSLASADMKLVEKVKEIHRLIPTQEV
jgi:predicted PurR-regulated permease PerM